MVFLRGVGLIALAGMALAAHGTFYTFDTDNQGWSRANVDLATFVMTPLGPATRSPGGYLEESDFSAWSFVLSPVLPGTPWLTNQILFDYSADATDNFAYPLVVVTNGAEALYVNRIPTADGQFHHYDLWFNQFEGWQYSNGVDFRAATDADMLNMAMTMKFIGINVDTHSGDDHVRVDNVQLAPLPEPVSLLGLLGLGALARLKKRNRA